jgi:hypothetical protein
MAKNSLHYCKCGEKKLYFGNKKLCPVCDVHEAKLASRDALRRNKKIIEGIIKRS